MKMDVSKFKKISSDSKKTVLKHPRGHEIVIAHDAVSPSTRKQLSLLPGMDRNPNEKSLSAIPSTYQERGPGTDFSNVNNMPRMAKGGGIGSDTQPMWHGVKSKIADWAGNGNPGLATQLPEDVKGRPEEQEMSDRTQEASRFAGPVQSEDIAMARGGSVRRYAEGTPNGVLPPELEPSAAEIRDASMRRLGISKYKQDIDSAPLPVDQADPSSTGNIGPQSPLATRHPSDDEYTPTTAGNTPPPAQPYQVPGGMQDLAQGYQTQLGGLQKQQQGAAQTAQVTGGLGAEQAGTLAGGVNQLNSLQNNYQQHYMDLTKDRQSLMKEVDSGAQHLDPTRFVKNMSTGSKILTGIGLLLGGMGSGLTKGPNITAEFLQRNIDKDMENQRLQLGTKQNLLDYNFRQTKDLRDATDFTKLNTMDMVGMHLKQQAAVAQNPLAQAELLKNAGIIDQKAGELQNQIAMRRTFMQIGSQGGAGSEQNFQSQNNMLRMMGEEGEKLAKTREEHHVPGLAGQSSIPVTDKDQGSFQEMQNLGKSFQEAQNYLSQAGAVGHPLPGAARAEGNALKNRIELSIGKLEGLNRFTHEEAVRYKEMIPDLSGTHLTGADRAKLNTLAQELQNKMGTFKSGFGLNPNSKTAEEAAPQKATGNEVERLTKDNKIAIFDGKSKKFLRYK